MKKAMFSQLLSDRRKLSIFSLLSMIIVMIGSGFLIFSIDEIERKNALRIDYSFNAVTSKSIQTDQILSDLNSNVHVYALFTPGQEDMALIGLLERYAAASGNFTFSIENLLSNPALIQHISSNLDDTAVSTDCLIVLGKAQDRTRILSFNDFITQEYDVQSGQFYAAGLRYEQNLTEAIVYVTSPDLASIQLLSGHGELSKDDTASMVALLRKYNYALREIDLLRGDILNPKELLMILSPSKDLTSKQLECINDFCRAGGAVFMATNFGVYEQMPNFEALLRNFGFQQKKGLVIAMEDESESYYNSPAILIPYMELAEPTASMIKNKQTTLILAGSAAFEEPINSNTNSLNQYVVLRSGNAYLRDTSDGTNNILKRPNDEVGSFPLAITAERLYDDSVKSKAFIIGNTSVFTDSWLYQNTYSSEFLLNLVQYLSPTKAPSIAITPKDAIRPPLQVKNYLINYIALILLPLAVCASAAIVLVPRKRR